MPEPAQPARQVKQHLDSLRAAGVQWLPLGRRRSGPPAVMAPPAAVARSVPMPVEPGPPPPPQVVAAPARIEPAADDRRQALTLLAKEVAGCTRCAELASTRTQTVFGVGPLDAELCFVGEAPGADEDARGEPFVGAAGQLLNRIIAACGMKREEVYICNILRCRPPGNRTPLPDEAANCRGFLERTLELIGPKFICCLGACAAQNLLQTTLSIGKLRGQFRDYRGIPVLCTYHPSYCLRNPPSKKDVWQDMQLLMKRMGRTIPQAGK